MKHRWSGSTVKIGVALAAAMALTGCGSTSEPPAAPTMRTSTEDLQGRVIAMRVAIYDGRYRDAYDIRSKKCQAAISLDDYTNAVAGEYAGKAHPSPDSLRVAVIASEDPSQGIYRAQAQLYEVGHETDPANETPRWWTVEDGLWKFDNCGTQQ